MKRLLAKVWRHLPLPKSMQLSIMRLFQDEFLIGVTGIFFDEENKVLLVKHTYRGDWSLPGGYLKAKEHPKEGLEREIEEETGYVVSADTRIKIRTDRDEARLDICYMGIYAGGEFHQSNEVSEAGFFSFESLPLLPKDQLVFIEHALRLKVKTSLAHESPLQKFQRYFSH